MVFSFGIERFDSHVEHKNEVVDQSPDKNSHGIQWLVAEPKNLHCNENSKRFAQIHIKNMDKAPWQTS